MPTAYSSMILRQGSLPNTKSCILKCQLLPYLNLLLLFLSSSNQAIQAQATNRQPLMAGSLPRPTPLSSNQVSLQVLILRHILLSALNPLALTLTISTRLLLTDTLSHLLCLINQIIIPMEATRMECNLLPTNLILTLTLLLMEEPPISNKISHTVLNAQNSSRSSSESKKTSNRWPSTMPALTSA